MRASHMHLCAHTHTRTHTQWERLMAAASECRQIAFTTGDRHKLANSKETPLAYLPKKMGMNQNLSQGETVQRVSQHYRRCNLLWISYVQSLQHQVSQWSW